MRLLQPKFKQKRIRSKQEANPKKTVTDVRTDGRLERVEFTGFFGRAWSQNKTATAITKTMTNQCISHIRVPYLIQLK